MNALLSGNTYIEVRTLAYPHGEIRGQLEASPSALWETGAPNKVLYGEQVQYLGYSSGNLPGTAQRWAAVPFSIPPGGAVISRIDVDWFVSPGYEAETIDYIIWQRTGATGTLGSYESGHSGTVTEDPDLPAYPDGSIVTLTAVPDPGKTFVGWSGDTSGSVKPLSLSMLGDMNIHAAFGLADADAGAPAMEFALEPVRPTPTSGPVLIRFALPSERAILLSVLDVQGREVARLAEGTYGPGWHQAKWSGRAGNGIAPVGMYFVRLAVPERSMVQRLVLAR